MLLYNIGLVFHYRDSYRSLSRLRACRENYHFDYFHFAFTIAPACVQVHNPPIGCYAVVHYRACVRAGSSDGKPPV